MGCLVTGDGGVGVVSVGDELTARFGSQLGGVRMIWVDWGGRSSPVVAPVVSGRRWWLLG